MDEKVDSYEIDWSRDPVELLRESDRAYLASYMTPHMLDELKSLLDAMPFDVREEVLYEAMRAAPVYLDLALIVAVARVYDRRMSRQRTPKEVHRS